MLENFRLPFLIYDMLLQNNIYHWLPLTTLIAEVYLQCDGTKSALQRPYIRNQQKLFRYICTTIQVQTTD